MIQLFIAIFQTATSSNVRLTGVDILAEQVEDWSKHVEKGFCPAQLTFCQGAMMGDSGGKLQVI